MSTRIKYTGASQERVLEVGGKTLRWNADNQKTLEIDDAALAADLITQDGFELASDHPSQDGEHLLGEAFPTSPPFEPSPRGRGK